MNFKNSRSIAIYIVLTCCCAVWSLADAAWAAPKQRPQACRRPAVTSVVDPAELAYRGTPQARLQDFRSGGKLHQWMVLSRGDGPGAMSKVLALDCQGRILARLEVNYMTRMTTGPRVAGLPTLEFGYRSVTGSGIQERSVGLLQLRDGAIHEIWDHVDNGYMSGWPVPDRVIRFRWRYVDGGSRIEITGAERRGPITDYRRAIATGRIIRQPREAWCYRRSANRFIACKVR